MTPKNDTDKLTELLAAANGDLLTSDLSQRFNDETVRVERVLLDLVRPDPVQPRRVLPDRVHQAFHNYQLTPSQAMRDLVQIAQMASRQRGRPFNSLQELLPDPDRDEADTKTTPEENLLRDLVNLAATIRDDGQVNPITVIDVSEGVTRQYRIETGERRYWAAWLLRDFLPGHETDGMIDCIVVPGDQATVFRQAKENTARSGLSAIAMARQAALLLLAVNGYDIPDYAVTNDFYRQTLELRIPRGEAEQIYAAMGGIDKVYFSYIKNLLRLSDDALELADRHNIQERRLRPLLDLDADFHFELVRQIIDFNLTAKQVEQVVAIDTDKTDEHITDEIEPDAHRLAKIIKNRGQADAASIAKALIKQEGNPELARAQARLMSQLYSDVAACCETTESSPG